MAKQLRKRASDDLVSGYTFAAELAERRRQSVAARGDHKEASAWGHIATYCKMMANARLVDAPDSEVAYVPPADETHLNLTLLNRILDREGEASPWTVEKRMALVAALHVLSSTERVVAEMYYGGVLSAPHIALALRTTTGTVESYLRRIRKKWAKLRETMG